MTCPTCTRNTSTSSLAFRPASLWALLIMPAAAQQQHTHAHEVAVNSKVLEQQLILPEALLLPIASAAPGLLPSLTA